MKQHEQRTQCRYQAPSKGVNLVQRRSTRAVFVFGILVGMANPTIIASLQLAVRAACSAAFALSLAQLLGLPSRRCACAIRCGCTARKR
jgi:hypothetical protein